MEARPHTHSGCLRYFPAPAEVQGSYICQRNCDDMRNVTRLFKSEVSHTEVCLSASTWVIATVKADKGGQVLEVYHGDGWLIVGEEKHSPGEWCWPPT